MQKKILQILTQIGELVLYFYEIFVQATKRPFRRTQVFRQIEFIGNQSLPIIAITSFFTGGVFGLQIGGIFTIFRAEGVMGGATGLALATELAPIISAFLLTGRVGASMTAEIATMAVNEQIDAIEAMGVSPIHYLVVPRVLASAIIMPVLCAIFMFMGVVGAYCIGVVIFEVDEGVFFENLVYFVEVQDMIKGLRKMFFFSFIISGIACRYGLNASKGAKGVGLATTDAVVNILLGVLCTDFVISYIEVRWFS